MKKLGIGLGVVGGVLIAMGIAFSIVPLFGFGVIVLTAAGILMNPEILR